MQNLKSSSVKNNIKNPKAKVAIVVSRFNSEITTKLLDGAVQGLKEAGIAQKNIQVHEVPGAFEIPLAAKWIAKSKKAHAVICLGVVIRGDTTHYDYVCEGATLGILEAQLETEVPMAFGILTTENVQQALDRSRDDETNKGYEAAKVVLEMLELKQKIKSKK